MQLILRDRYKETTNPKEIYRKLYSAFNSIAGLRTVVSKSELIRKRKRVEAVIGSSRRPAPTDLQNPKLVL